MHPSAVFLLFLIGNLYTIYNGKEKERAPAA